MSRRRRRNKHDKYGIYEIPNYNITGKRKKRKKKSVTVKGVFKIIAFVICIIGLAYAVYYGVKYSIKKEAVILYDEGDYQGAIDLFNEALKPQLPLLTTFDNDIRLYLADCYVNIEEYELAVYEYEKIRFWSEENNVSISRSENVAKGLMYYKRNDYKQALPILQSAYEEGYGDLVLYVGSCYGQLGDLDNMQLYYNVFLQKHEMNSFMYAQYAAISLNEGNLEQALEYIENGKEAKDQSNIKEILFDEIVYYEKIKDYNTAFEKAELFMESYPLDQDGKKEYDLLYTRQKITEK